MPDESWSIAGYFAERERAQKLGPAWREFLGEPRREGQRMGRRSRARTGGWVSTTIRAELVELDGSKFDVGVKADEGEQDVTASVKTIAEACGRLDRGRHHGEP
ncbi:MAG: hypothetical protein R3B49_00105 [Phycisphaerales bacterium]